MPLTSDWLTSIPNLFNSEFSYNAIQLLESILLEPGIVSIPCLIILTVVITINWADKVPTLPFHFVKKRLIMSEKSVMDWKRSLVVQNIEQTLSKVFTHHGELLSYLGEESLSRQAEKTLEPHIEEYVDEVMTTDFSLVWENLPPYVKRRAYRRASSGLPKFIDNLVEDISHHSDQLLDYGQLTEELLQQQPLKLDQFFKVDRFYKQSQILIRAAFFAFLFSLPVTLFSIYLHLTPALLNNYFVLNIILILVLEIVAVVGAIFFTFYSIYSLPSERPRGRSLLSNILIANRTKIIEMQSGLIAFQIFKLNKIVRFLFKGPNIPLTQKLIRRHLHPLIETFFTKIIIQLFFGLSGFLRLKKQATEKIALLADYPFEDRIFQEDRSKRISGLLKERLESLPDSDICNLARPFLTYQSTKTLLCSASTMTTMILIQLYILV